MRTSHFAAIALALAATAAAQNKTVSPAALTNAYGGLNNSIPWGPFVPSGNTTGEIMVQQIDDQLLGQTLVLQAMAFRHQYTSTHVAKAFTAQVTLADAATPAAAISTTFASNFLSGGSQTVVLNGTINFPAVGPYPLPPAAFDAPVMFSTPHVYTGVNPLLWEVIITASNPVTPTQFYERGPGTTHTAGRVGVGCAISGGTSPLTLSGTATTTSVSNTLTNGPPNAPAVFVIGDTSPTFNGLPLPFNLALIGSPNCDLNINPILFLSTATDASGGSSFPIPFTMSPSVSGSRLRTQFAAVDGTAIVTSNGLDHGIPYTAATGKPWPQARVYANGWGATPPATGSIQANGLVTEWTH